MKSFERIWKEYINYKDKELEAGEIDKETIDLCRMELEENKEYYMEFYLFLELNEYLKCEK